MYFSTVRGAEEDSSSRSPTPQPGVIVRLVLRLLTLVVVILAVRIVMIIIDIMERVAVMTIVEIVITHQHLQMILIKT